MNKYYLVKYKNKNVYGMSVLWNTDKEKIESISEKYFPLEHHTLGNNKIIYNNLESLLECYEWNEIDKDVYYLLFRIMGYVYGDFFYPVIDDQDDYWACEENVGNGENNYPYGV